MLVSDVISRVRGMSGDVAVLQFSDQDILNWLNDGVRECAIINNLLQKRGNQVVTANVTDYALPTDVLKLHSIKYDSNKLPVLTLEEFDEQYPGVTSQSISGTPTVCYVWAGSISLYPAPDNSTKTLSIDYLYDPAPTELGDIGTTQVPLPVGYHQRIVDYCLAQVAQQDDDLQRYQLKMQEFQTGVQQLKDQPESTYDLYPSMSVDARDMGDDWSNYTW